MRPLSWSSESEGKPPTRLKVPKVFRVPVSIESTFLSRRYFTSKNTTYFGHNPHRQVLPPAKIAVKRQRTQYSVKRRKQNVGTPKIEDLGTGAKKRRIDLVEEVSKTLGVQNRTMETRNRDGRRSVIMAAIKLTISESRRTEKSKKILYKKVFKFPNGLFSPI